MDKGFTVRYEGDHIRVDSWAERSIDYATALWTEVSELCQKCGCYDVLVVSKAPGPMPTIDAYDHGALFKRLKIYGQYRIAFAELNDDARPATRFAQTVLFNRGLPGEVFATESEAREWLVSAASDTDG